MANYEKEEITPDEIVFCEEYIKTNNATTSYEKYKPNCSHKTAGVEGCKMLKKPRIKKYIEERMATINKKHIADANEILEFLTSTLRGEVKDQLGFETSVKDRIKAGELLAKRYKLFEEKNGETSETKTTPKIELEVIDNSDLEKTLYENR